MFRILRTTTFRFTIIYVLVFAIAVALLGALFYQMTFGVMSLQTDETIDSEIEVLSEVFSQEGAGALRRVMRDRSAWRDDGLYILIGEPAGAVLAGNLTALPPEALRAGEGFFDFSFERPRINAAGRETGIETREARGKIRRFKATPDAQMSFLVFVARDVSTREALRKRSQQQMASIGAATIALGILIGLLSSRTLLRRVDAVNRTARAIRGGDLSRRIALTGTGDELENLAINLNAMLDQIERLMDGMKEVSDNIAHDLRSPLNRIKARLTDALNARADEKDAALRATLDDAENMIGTFNALLSIARIESGEGAGAMESVDLVAIAQEMVELYEPAMQDAGFVLQLRTTPAPPVRGSRALISQALANLLDNALKYAVGGTTVRIDIRKGTEGRVLLSVLDDGPGVPPSERESVLKRFVRLEQSRSTPGSGLGLSLVAAIARGHGGSITLGEASQNPDKRGLKVTMAFPAYQQS
jgi:signal transduction histidine kinase